ncbi:MAG: hypothetical protein WCA85_28855 [Paraburkholderia sp.]|uniref:hypothetical protein n=1 Tax=Paraburkholderia sp. TaxID=1926495 RepID=UPI003C63216A
MARVKAKAKAKAKALMKWTTAKVTLAASVSMVSPQAKGTLVVAMKPVQRS